MTASPRNSGPLRLLLTASLAASLLFGLAACGKKGSPKPPEGQESEYTFPRSYPAPDTVVPGGTEATEATPQPSDSLPIEGYDPFSIFKDGKRTRTKTY